MSDAPGSPKRAKVAVKEKSAGDSPLRARPVADRPYPKQEILKELFQQETVSPTQKSDAADLSPSTSATRVKTEERKRTKKVSPATETPKSEPAAQPKTASKAKAGKKNEPKPDIHSQATIVEPRHRSGAPEVGADGKKAAPPPKNNATNNNVIRAGLVLLVLGLVWFGLFGRNDSDRISQAERQQIEERVNYHRGDVGRRLNRQRINAEYENQQTAPTLNDGARPVPQADMMAGLPLKPEAHHRETSRERMEPMDPDSPDARVQYQLQEQQALNDWERNAQKQYIDEFVANAAREGYRVQVDRNGGVKVLGRIPAQSQPGSADAGRTGRGSIR